MIRRLISAVRRRIGRDEFTSLALRKEFNRRYGIDVGLYSYGCFDPRRIDRKTLFGRYCSVAPTARVLRRNHGTKFLALTPYLYNSNLGIVHSDQIEYAPLTIGDDVWLGHNSVILPSVNTIGRGAIVAAGAIVTSDVEPYSIVGGNPARLIRKRFKRATIEKIEDSKWWEMTPEELKEDLRKRPDFYFCPEDTSSAASESFDS